MFFLARSALCIGIVVTMLPGKGDPGALGDVAAAAGRVVSSEVQSVCASRARCADAGMAVGKMILTNKARLPAPPRGDPASTDSLLLADLAPSWRGPPALPVRDGRPL